MGAVTALVVFAGTGAVVVLSLRRRRAAPELDD
jgi:hypothetical protein